jgi:hypothetical protein
MAKRDIRKSLEQLAQAESEFLKHKFLAPVTRGAGVQVRIAGVKCKLRVEPSDFEGWGVFQPLDYNTARVVSRPNLADCRRYLQLFPSASLVLCRSEHGRWWAIAGNKSDERFKLEGLVPVQFVEDADLFDVVTARFDGAQFWFESVNTRVDPGAAAYLRQSIGRMLEPRSLDRPALDGQQRAAYTLCFAQRLEQQLADERASGEHRLREALAHARAELRDYTERAGVFRVTYVVDGRTYTSAVEKSDLSVRSAGICLSGEDQKFDLASLVGVLREGRQGGSLR